MDCGGGDQGEMEGARGRERERECHTVVRETDLFPPCWENKESCCCFLSKVPSMILHLASPIIIYRVQSLAHSSSFALVLDGAGGFSASPFRPSPGTIRVVSESYAYITNIAFTPNPAQCLRLSSPRHFLLLLLLLPPFLLLLRRPPPFPRTDNHPASRGHGLRGPRPQTQPFRELNRRHRPSRSPREARGGLLVPPTRHGGRLGRSRRSRSRSRSRRSRYPYQSRTRTRTRTRSGGIGDY